MTIDQESYLSTLREFATSQDRAKFSVLVEQYSATLRKFRRARAEIDAFIGSRETQDYIALAQRIEPYLITAKEFIEKIEKLPIYFKKSREVQDFVEKVTSTCQLEKIAGLDANLDSICIEVGLRLQAEKRAEELAKEEAAKRAAFIEKRRDTLSKFASIKTEYDSVLGCMAFAKSQIDASQKIAEGAIYGGGDVSRIAGYFSPEKTIDFLSKSKLILSKLDELPDGLKKSKCIYDFKKITLNETGIGGHLELDNLFSKAQDEARNQIKIDKAVNVALFLSLLPGLYICGLFSRFTGYNPEAKGELMLFLLSGLFVSALLALQVAAWFLNVNLVKLIKYTYQNKL